MATKTKTATNGAETIDSALHSGAETMKDSFEKAAKSYDQFMSFGKENADAVMKCATAAGKGIETINSEVFAYARRSLEESIAATKAVIGSKSLDEAFQRQSEYGKAAFETYIDQLARVGELTMASAKDATSPLQARVAALADLVGRAA
jgi:phasin family protein